MEPKNTKPPLQCGQRLLPVLIDDIARDNPARIFAAIPCSNNPQDGFEDISYLDFSSAINRCSWWIETKVGKGSNFESLAYVGPLDLLYHIITLAAVKTHHKAFLPSHRNSTEANISLLAAIDCRIVIFHEDFQPYVDRMSEGRKLQKLRVPGLEYFLRKERVPHYDYRKTFTEARLSPFVVLHTSGSTAMPKPVIVNHGTLVSMDAYQLISHLGSESVIGPALRGSRMLMGFPLFHMASFTLLLGFGAYYGVIGVLPPAAEPITARLIHATHVNADVQGSALPPSLIVDLYHEQGLADGFQRLDYMFYAGGSLLKDVGDTISSITHLATLFGSTEIGYPPMKVLDRTDWQYVSYSPFDGHEFRSLEEEGLYEHVIVRQSYLNLFQSVFSTYPSQDKYSTNDLYRKHPTKPHLWKFCGRGDDVIVYSNAEKYNPVDFEDMVSSHPAVKSALMGGHGEFQSCLLVEPKSEVAGEDDQNSLLNIVWPAVQAANQSSPAHARVMKDFIIFTRKDKPAERSGKGTIQRLPTLQLYHEDIKRLYQSPELPKISPRELVQTGVQGLVTLRNALYQLVLASGWLDGNLCYNTDLFELGLDSLQTLALSKQINAYLMQTMPTVKTITPSTIYTHSSIERLASALTATAEPSEERPHQKMQETFDAWANYLPETTAGASVERCNAPVVLLSGSTGSLGSYILNALLDKSPASKIYCLNRDHDSRIRQTRSFEIEGFKPDFKSVVFLQADLSKQAFGLESAEYNGLTVQVTHIIHNAWDVNFDKLLESFIRPHISGVCHMNTFCAQSKFNAQLFFVSSESTVLGQQGIDKGPVAEQVYSDWAYAQQTGYAQAKLVSERPIDTATRKSNIRSTILRIGQIAGPTTQQGVWNTREWFPRLIANSVRLQMLPNPLPFKKTVDWVPVDIVSQVIVELLFQPYLASNPPESDNSTDFGIHDADIRSSSDKLNTEAFGRQNTSSQPHDFQPAPHEVEQAECSSNGLKVTVVDFDKEQDDIVDPHAMSSDRSISNGKPDQSTVHSTRVFHIANPHPKPWHKILPILQEACSTPLHLKPFPEWLTALQQQPENEGTPEELQRVALLEHLNDPRLSIEEPQAILGTTTAVRSSPTLAALGPVNDAWIRTWMQHWGFSGRG